jgi:hypothetical protein
MNRRSRGRDFRIPRSALIPKRGLGSDRGRHLRSIVGANPQARLDRAGISGATHRCRSTPLGHCVHRQTASHSMRALVSAIGLA